MSVDSPMLSIVAEDSSLSGINPDGTVNSWGVLQVRASRTLENVTSIALGADHQLCAITADQRVVCVNDSNKQSAYRPVPPELQNVKVLMVSVGRGFTCVITILGELKCWGPGYPSIPNDLGKLRGLSTQAMRICVIRADESGKCFGDIKSPDWLENERVVSIRIGTWGRACALLVGGAVKCWGSDTEPPKDLGPAREIALGHGHACAVLLNNTLRCWGSDEGWGATTVDPYLRVFNGGQP